MTNKIVVLLSTIFPAKKPTQTVEPTRTKTLGTQIRSEIDYSHMFRGW